MRSCTPYMTTFLSHATLQRLEAGAYEQLCEHLRQRSDEVQNIDLMTISGFCRNCLAKWLVVEARRYSEELKKNGGEARQIQALDALGYDEAAEYVYGMAYDDWKKQHSKKATDQVMEKYNASQSLWATHDKDLLAVKAEKPTATSSSTLLSNVCCQDPELVAPPAPAATAAEPPKKTTRIVTPQVPPPPAHLSKFTVGILTISDRASKGNYETGDLSGPAVEQALMEFAKKYSLQAEITHKEIVPDSIDAIQSQLKAWSAQEHLHLVLTTGGTGFAPRDVTPEATKAILEQECSGLMAYVANECAKQQPLSALSRGTAGVCGTTFIVNLPGNPKGVEEIVPVLMPLAVHAIADLQQQQ